MSIEQPNSRARHRKLTLPNGVAEAWLEQAGSNVQMHNVRPNGGGQSNWRKCENHNCLGQAVIKMKCIAHAASSDVLQYLATCAQANSMVSLHGISVTESLWKLILGSPYFSQNTISASLNFSGAEINAPLRLENYTFEGEIIFHNAIVRHSITFVNCKFQRGMNAQFAFFDGGPPHFRSSIFHGRVDLSYAHAQRVSIGFSDCDFEKPFSADGLCGTLLLQNCSAKSDFSAESAKAEMILMRACRIDGKLSFKGTECKGFQAPNFRTASAHQIGPMKVEHDCIFTHAEFSTRVRFEIDARRLDFSGARLLNGGHIIAEKSSLSLGQVSTGRRLLVSGSPNPNSGSQVLDLQDADTGSMTFAHVDMSRCIFYGSHDLANVMIEPTVKFASSPRWLSRRRCVADEFAWRRNIGGYRSWGWKLPGTRTDAELVDKRNNGDSIALPALSASQVATVYRQLRSSLEAKSDKPGAADFYYGEMEMRRHSKEFGRCERFIVWLYWLSSGYGLRASRALTWLVILIICGAVAASNFGFTQGEVNLIDGLIFALRAVLPGLRRTNSLTTAGEFIEIGLTLLGPLFFALALLALRGRVRR